MQEFQMYGICFLTVKLLPEHSSQEYYELPGEN